MKRFLILLAILVVIAAAVVFVLKYDREKPLVGDVNNYDKVSIQLEPHRFYDVRVPPEAVLLSSDYESNYEFDLLSISKLDAVPKVCDIYTTVGDTNIVANSKSRMLAATQAGFDEEDPYTIYVDWEDKLYIEGTPAVPSLPEGAVQVANSTYVGEGANTTPMSDNSVVWYTEDGFMQGSVIFSEYPLAIEAYAAKFLGLYGTDFSGYYHQDAIFFAESGDFYVGVRYINKNTQYAIAGKGAIALPYFLNSLYNGGSPVGKGGEITFIPKETTSGEIN
jgi:hypothetical protein